MNKTNIILVTGGFDPLHSGHIAYFKASQKLGDKLIVGLNSDAWLIRKKGRAFMPFADRKAIISNLMMVDDVIEFNDNDNSACDAISIIKTKYSKARITFANGGDRQPDNTPEQEKFKTDPQIRFMFGIGGDNKLNSSSWILDEWKAPKTTRPWGYYRVLHEDDGVKVKELTVDPGKSLSMQRHNKRSEFWLIASNKGMIKFETELQSLNKHEHIHIAANTWHQLYNPFNEPCKVIEIQYGIECIENDIERQ